MGTGIVTGDDVQRPRRSRLRLLATAGAVATVAMTAGLAGGATQGRAAPAFTAPGFDMNIGKPGHAFVYPFGMAWDPTSNTLLVDDYVNYNVKRFTPDGSLLGTYSAKGTKTGQFSEQPSEIAVDPTDGDFVQAFAFNGYGYMQFSANGTFIRKVTSSVAYYAPFIAVSASGVVYLVQSTGLNKSNPNIVLMYNEATGASMGQFGANGTNCSKGQFGVIRGIDVDNYGNVFVNDVSNHCIQVFTSSGKFEGYFGNKTQLSANTRGLKLDRTNGVVYVADAAKEWVVAYNNLTYSGTTFTGASFEGDLGTPGLSVGSSCGGNGELDAPRDIAVGPGGTVYVSDYACWIVDTFNPLFDSTNPGMWLNQIPDPSIPAAPGGLNSANGVTVGPDGTVYVADTFNQRIQEFAGINSTTATPGSFIQQWGSRLPNLDGQFSLDYPRGIAVDPSTGNVWVSDTRSGYIKQYTTSAGPPATVAFDSDFGGEGTSLGDFFYSDGITVAPPPAAFPVVPEALYVVDSGFGYFQVLDESGTIPISAFPCGTLVEPDVFNGCTSAAVDANGDIYAASFNEGLVDVFTPGPGFNPACDFGLPVCYTLAAQLGSTAPGGTLGGPYGVAISGNTLYVTQSTKNDVSAFDISAGPAGPFTYLGSWGSKGSNNGQFNRPLGIATDSAGNIYVDDYGNGRVSVFNP